MESLFDFHEIKSHVERNLVPLAIIVSTTVVSLLVRSILDLKGYDGWLGFQHAINDMVKVLLSLGIAWLFLKDKSVAISKKRFPKIEGIIGIIATGIVVINGYLPLFGFDVYFGKVNNFHFSLITLINSFIFLGIPLVLTARHYSRRESRIFIKDFGFSIPSIRMVACWALTLLLMLILNFVSAGDKGMEFLGNYAILVGLRGVWYLPLVMAQVFLKEELFFRVFMQTRFEKAASLGWAMIVQSIAWWSAHLAGITFTFGWGYGLLVIVLYMFHANALIAGYLWYKTRNLPLLALYHWFVGAIYPFEPISLL